MAAGPFPEILHMDRKMQFRKEYLVIWHNFHLEDFFRWPLDLYPLKNIESNIIKVRDDGIFSPEGQQIIKFIGHKRQKIS